MTVLPSPGDALSAVTPALRHQVTGSSTPSALHSPGHDHILLHHGPAHGALPLPLAALHCNPFCLRLWHPGLHCAVTCVPCLVVHQGLYLGSCEVSGPAPGTPPSSNPVNIQAAASRGGVGSSSSRSNPNPPESATAQQQQEETLAAAQPVVHGAARAAAATAVASGLPADEVLLAAARAAAEALQQCQRDLVLPVVEASMLVVRAATAAAAAGGRCGSAAPDAMALGAQNVGSSTVSHACPTRPASGVAAVSSRSKAARPRRKCVVCLDARPSVTTHPCGHRVLCGGCAALVAGSKGECPMCRAPVVRFEPGTPGRS